MSEYYLVLRNAHIGCAIATIALFVLRGSLMLADPLRRNGPVLRYLPHAVDTVLLTTALMLATIIRAALATIGFLLTVARAHHPLGVFAAL
jgi:uncharacterized membrane protein SirB2